MRNIWNQPPLVIEVTRRNWRGGETVEYQALRHGKHVAFFQLDFPDAEAGLTEFLQALGHKVGPHNPFEKPRHLRDKDER